MAAQAQRCTPYHPWTSFDSLTEKKFYACRPLSECEEGMLSKRVFWREDINPRDFDPNDQNRSGLAATIMAPVNGLNGESEWCEWTTAGQSKVHFITE